MWNTEVKCVHCSNNGHLIAGKAYKIVDGVLTTEKGADYVYKDIDDLNKYSLVNYFEEVKMGKSKWNGKVRCLKAYNCRYLTEGKIYDVVDGVLTNNLGLKAVYVSLDALNHANKEALFEEVFDKPNKLKLLLKDGYNLTVENKDYKIYKYPDYTFLSIYNKDCKCTEYNINWGKQYNTTLADIQPILDILNIEIVEEQPKYKVDIEGEYSEEELEALKSAGIKFKKVGE